MTGPQILALVVIVAVFLLATKVSRRGRFHCGACGDRFNTESGLNAHVDAEHGRCSKPGPARHSCYLPFGHPPDEHVCGCGLIFKESPE